MYPLSSWILSCRIRWPYEVTVCSISGCHYINPYHAELIRVPTQVCAFMKPAGVDTVAFLRKSPCFRHHLLELRQRMQTGGHSFSVNWEMCESFEESYHFYHRNGCVRACCQVSWPLIFLTPLWCSIWIILVFVFTCSGR